MPKYKTWRQTYAPQIAATIKALKAEGKTVKEMKKILCELNPGQYGHHRKTWANEYMIQLGLSKKKTKSSAGKDQPGLF